MVKTLISINVTKIFQSQYFIYFHPFTFIIIVIIEAWNLNLLETQRLHESNQLIILHK